MPGRVPHVITSQHRPALSDPGHTRHGWSDTIVSAPGSPTPHTASPPRSLPRLRCAARHRTHSERRSPPTRPATGRPCPSPVSAGRAVVPGQAKCPLAGDGPPRHALAS
ncbi:hypothetical protein FHR81_003172 [Actinoalloteichus hoggarensis]|nr:hypothetical protein [Actinoalloteichus hoggarensis]